MLQSNVTDCTILIHGLKDANDFGRFLYIYISLLVDQYNLAVKCWAAICKYEEYTDFATKKLIIIFGQFLEVYSKVTIQLRLRYQKM